MAEASIQFIEALAARFPNIGVLLREHREDNSGETLPHVIMGDITRHAETLSDVGQEATERELLEILDFLEKSFSAGNEEVQNVIAASFLENLPSPGEPGGRVRGLVGSALAKQLDRFDKA